MVPFPLSRRMPVLSLINRIKINNTIRLDLYNFWDDLSRDTGMTNRSCWIEPCFFIKRVIRKEGIQSVQQLILKTQAQKDLEK